MEFVLTPQDFEKCQNGYGCTNCLCDYNGMYLPRCPDCGMPTMINPGHVTPLQKGDESFHFDRRRR